MTIWMLWAILLIAQNASFTWVSRARNSGSLGYHAMASVASNGVWIIGQFMIFDMFVQARQAENLFLLTAVCLYYTLFTVLGSVGMHHVLMKYVESGKRKVGAT
jgi:hypothetical protein